MFVESVFWFHPLVWWIGKRIVEERERACDEEVLRLGSEPRTYAKAIIKVCELYLKSPLECVAGVTSSNLSKRIEEIMDNRTVQRLVGRKKLLLAGAGVTALTIPLMVGMLNSPPLRAQSKAAQSTLQGHNIIGTWQGFLRAGPREQRIVFKISLEDNKLKAVMYQIDQGGQGISASAITRDGPAIRITVAARGGHYEGKLTSDGKAIAGTWTEGEPLPLNLALTTPETAWAIPDAPPPPKLMSSDASPVFEVATIKPSKSAEGGVSIQVSPSGLVNTTSTSLSHLMKFAYDLHPRQIAGGPAWLENEKYDITAKPDMAGMPSGIQLKVMIQKLLAERFQLSFHRDKRELSVYAITVAKSGLRLNKNDSDQNDSYAFDVRDGRLSFTNGTMAEFASVLQASGSIPDRPVVDQTGLGSARYDFTLMWTLDGRQSQLVGDNADAPPDLFSAFQQQLGLKLEPTKAPVDVFVIDRAEKPSGN